MLLLLLFGISFVVKAQLCALKLAWEKVQMLWESVERKSAEPVFEMILKSRASGSQERKEMKATFP